MAKRSPLDQAFLDDHRAMMDGLAGIVECLEAADLEGAVALAETVDRQAGAHIRFEEDVLYREVARARGAEYASRLYAEHQRVRRGIETLLACRGERRLGTEVRRQVLEDVRVGLDHAVSCGTLLSLLTPLDAEAQQAMLDRLLELRKLATPWHALPRGRS
jgi:hypothetical protein